MSRTLPRRFCPVILLAVVLLVTAATYLAVTSASRTAANPSSSTESRPGPHSIGYIGCSNTADTVAGYYLVQNAGLFWSPYSTGGGSLDRWASSTSNYWALFEQEVQKYGAPSVVWIEICERYTSPLNYTVVQDVFAVLKERAPSAVYYISPLNSYSSSDVCGLTGPNGVVDAARLAAEAESNGLAKAGPILGPLTPQTTQSDMCHPNQAGETLLGSQLAGFFDHLSG